MSRLELLHEVQQFLFREARLLDDRQFRDWLELLTEDIQYWAPSRETVDKRGEPVRARGEMALFDDDKSFLTARIQRLETGFAHAETPPSRTRRLLTNFELLDVSDNGVTVTCNFILYQTRLERSEAFYVGRREDSLLRVDDGWRISARKIVLDQTLLPRSVSILF